MPQPPINNARLFLRNSTTVDTGASVDVRALDDVNNNAIDETQTVSAAHTNDSVERCFDPASAVSNPLNAFTLNKLGWAPALADFTPTDTRCQAILKAGGATVTCFVTCTRSGSVPLTASTGLTFKASLWRYDPVANTGVVIATGSSAAVSYDMTGLNTVVTQSADIALSWASDVFFVRGEAMLLQIGLNTGTLGNPATGTTTYVFALQIDDDEAVSTSFLFTGTTLRASCALAAAGALTLNAQRVARVIKKIRAGQLTLTGASTASLVITRSFIAQLHLDGIRGPWRIGKALIAQLHLDGFRRPWAIRLARSDLSGALSLSASRVVRRIGLGRADLVGQLSLNGAHSRVKTMTRSFAAQLSLNGAFGRGIIFGRHFIANLTLGASWLVRISQAILNRMVSGGTTVIKKIFPVFD